MNNNISLSCPNCKQPDSVRKLNSIYEDDLTKATATIQSNDGGNSAGNKVAQPLLATSFPPPEKPVKPNNNLVYLMIITLAVGVYLVWSFLNISDDYSKVIAQVIFMPLWALFLTIVLIVAGSMQIRRKNSYHNQLERWQKGKLKWDKLYYCARCKGVFGQSENQFIPINQIDDYLYE